MWLSSWSRRQYFFIIFLFCLVFLSFLLVPVPLRCASAATALCEHALHYRCGCRDLERDLDPVWIICPSVGRSPGSQLAGPTPRWSRTRHLSLRFVTDDCFYIDGVHFILSKTYNQKIIEDE